MIIDAHKPDWPLSKVTPEFFRRVSGSTTWYISPSWISNGHFGMPRDRLTFKFDTGKDIKRIVGGNEIQYHDDSFFNDQVWNKYTQPEHLLMKKRYLPELSAWLFRDPRGCWALISALYVNAFQLKTVYAPKFGYNGVGALLLYMNIVVMPVKPTKWGDPELKEMTADEYERHLDGKGDELPLFNPPRRIVWKGMCHA
jgi:hypothetical protein